MSRFIDVCNGDADGLCAVVQWRLAHPAQAELVTGLKRDIELLDRVQAGPGDDILVCDLSMQRNGPALRRLLAQGARVRYFDHHHPGEVPVHPQLQAHLDGDPRLCTSLLMDRFLQGRHRAWALVGAYGDNLGAEADRLAEAAGWDAAQRAVLRRLGEAINYNAYGDTPTDVLLAPAELFEHLRRHPDPLQAWASDPVFAQLDERRCADLEQGLRAPLRWESARTVVRELPDAPWSRRVVGVLANEMVQRDPARAQVVLQSRNGGYLVSLRAPQDSVVPADALCRRFGGGGRAAAAGIDRLRDDQVPDFLAALDQLDWLRPA
ncbi:MAG: DHHA1 domain-containing protein [Caldimonas sp.]|uniref:DHHA1 domain-containing protein n=1 Tax=Caldimonas sp. TaxID=2838790 RepID=UPI00391C5C15